MSFVLSYQQHQHQMSPVSPFTKEKPLSDQDNGDEDCCDNDWVDKNGDNGVLLAVSVPTSEKSPKAPIFCHFCQSFCNVDMKEATFWTRCRTIGNGGKGLNATWFPQQIIDQLLPPAALHPLREETFNHPPQNLSGPLDTSFSDCNILAEQWKEIKVYYGPHFLLSKNFTPELVAISVPPLMKVGLQKEERANRKGRNFIVVESPSPLHTFGWDLCGRRSPVSTFGICLPSFALPVQGILCTVHV